jgi:hypothetical protein
MCHDTSEPRFSVRCAISVKDVLIIAVCRSSGRGQPNEIMSDHRLLRLLNYEPLTPEFKLL